MWVGALPFIRRTSRFELFYFSHLLYVGWLVLCLLHGPVFYLWAGVPLIGLAAEQLLRKRQRGQESTITSLSPLSSGVTEVTLARPPGFQHQAGDYAFLRIPSLARHEWHPFTISSAPERSEVTMHVRSLGNFTSALRALAQKRVEKGETRPLRAHLDGPYGTPSTRIFESKNVVLVGAGIGVTPFAAVLESIVLRATTGGPRPNKVHFFWLNRDAYSFEWFAELLLRLEKIDQQGLVQIHIYMTAGRGHLSSAALNFARAISHRLGKPDLVTGLRAKTNVGRPDWGAELKRIANEHEGEAVDLFFCGPPGLGHRVEQACRDYGVGFRKEHF
jgi:predicted ferric reductase